MKGTEDVTADATFVQREADNARNDDFFTFEFRGREIRCFRRLIGNRRTDTYYVKCEVHGKQIFRGTGETKKGRATDIAKLIVGAALDAKWDALRETKLRQDRPVATIGEILSAFERNIGQFNLTLKEKTMNGYMGALRSLLRKVHEGDVHKLSGNVLTEQLVEKYFATHVKEAGEDLLERDKRIRGANSTINNARAVFGRDAMKCYRGMVMPDLTGFMKATTADNPDVQHEEIAPETVWEIAQAALFLKEQAPSLYLVHLLYRHLGMRNDEIENARVEWIERKESSVWLPNGEKRDIAAWMVIKRRSYWIPKRGIGEVPIAPEVLAEIEQLIGDAKPTDLLVPARTPTERADLVDRDHANFMRPWVADHSKVSYELRRWGATLMEVRQGAEFRDRFLRHKDRSVGGKHYSTRRAAPAPITLGDCGL